jgi:2-dehydropantoate 2-reductase
VLPLLNGLDHLALLRKRLHPATVLAGTIRVEADRPQPGVIVHTSPFLLVEMASRHESARDGMAQLARAFEGAGVKARADWPICERSEAQVMWSKLVRLNALACTTSAYDKLLGEIRSTPRLRADLEGAIAEACAVGQAEGADDVDPQKAIGELQRAHETLGSSMQRDIAAGRTPELDAIPGSVLRAAARHGLQCPTIERLVALIAARAGVPTPVIAR